MKLLSIIHDDLIYLIISGYHTKKKIDFKIKTSSSKIAVTYFWFVEFLQ